MASEILSFAGWLFLPNLATTYLQSALYAVFIRAGDPKPPPGSQRYIRDRKRIHVFVVVTYLLYTLYEADYYLRQAGDLYQSLGVSHDVDEKGLQSRFRRLTVQFHPDKLPSTISANDRSAAEAIYIRLKFARDVLVEPAKRFAYDRFGPESLSWRGSKTIGDFVFTGAQSVAIQYAVSAAMLLLLSVLGYLSDGIFWRYLVLASMFIIEIATISRPQFPWILTGIMNPILLRTRLHPPLLPFQMLTLLRKAAITFFIALSQLAPVLQGSRAGSDVPEQLLTRLDQLATGSEQGLNRLMGLELAAFASEERKMKDLKLGLREWLVQNTIRNDPEVDRAVTAVLRQRSFEE